MANLVNQPTAAPERKVVAGTVAGGLIAAAMTFLQAVRPDLASLLGPIVLQATPIIVAFIAAYFTRSEAQ